MNWTRISKDPEISALTDERRRETHRVKYRKIGVRTRVYDCYRRDSRGWSLFEVIVVEDGDTEAAKAKAKWIVEEDVVRCLSKGRKQPKGATDDPKQ